LIRTAGSDEKCALALAARRCVRDHYRTEDFVARVREITGAKA